MPAGVVYIQQPAEGEAEMRAHFRKMRALGFNALKQILPLPDWTVERIQHIALEEGIVPWWFGEGGCERPTAALRARLGVPPELSDAAALRHPAMVAHQRDFLRRRIERTVEFIRADSQQRFLRTSSVAFDPEVGGRGLELTAEGERQFVEWLRRTYGTVEALEIAWNQRHAGLFPETTRAARTWDDVARTWKDTNRREYRHLRDVLRFKAEHAHTRIRRMTGELAAFDPFYPFRGGGELGLFLPSAAYGVDLGGIADAVADAGSFYPSMHFSWHFDQVNHEISRPLYMQASLMADLFKGGWTGGWESTGGPQQLDGERGNLTANSYYVGAGELMQLYLSQLAGGFRGFGIWCWNARSAGKEAGEYSLLDRNGAVTDRAVRIGRLGQALDRHREELWTARKEPLVGVLYDWENEAAWAALSFVGRESARLKPVEARVGVSRALIDGNIPFEYVTPTDLRRGLAARYRVIYLPAILALQRDVLGLLTRYVADGGRLVMDLPTAWYDEWLRLLPTGRGSPFAALFGATLDDFQYSGVNRTLRLEGRQLDGFTASLTPLTARVAATYDDASPAITENRHGAGTAVILGWEASASCHRPGNVDGQAALLRHALGDLKSPYACAEIPVYRLAAPAADHFVLINDGSARTVCLDPRTLRYRRVADALTGEEINLRDALPIAAHDARWLRAEK
jgi:beta-galactosidase